MRRLQVSKKRAKSGYPPRRTGVAPVSIFSEFNRRLVGVGIAAPAAAQAEDF
jgi:hypothetical protein